MEGESLLTVTAEVGIAIAGFSAIAVALRGREEPWSECEISSEGLELSEA
jgi:hypothetical protein